MALFDKAQAKPEAQDAVNETVVAPVAETPAKAETKASGMTVGEDGKRYYNGRLMSEKNAGRVDADMKKREALERIVKYIADNNITELLEDAKIVRPSFFGLGGGGGAGFAKKEYSGAQETLAKLLDTTADKLDASIVGKEFDEVAAFTKARKGRVEMREAIKALIVDPRKLQPIWVEFKAETGVYKVVAVGEKPADWKGYTPKAKEDK